jgi:GxxExxY protein
MELLFKNEAYKIIGASMEVYNHLGFGFLEAVYQEALGREFSDADIPFLPYQKIQIYYKSKLLEKYYVADFICNSEIIVEIKAQECLGRFDDAQLINYLKATGLRLGLLINFGNKKTLEWKRLIYDEIKAKPLSAMNIDNQQE